MAKDIGDLSLCRCRRLGGRDVNPMWTLASHPFYDLLVNDRGRAPERYSDWLADTLARAVLAGQAEIFAAARRCRGWQTGFDCDG
jgi:hypothetical protein